MTTEEAYSLESGARIKYTYLKKIGLSKTKEVTESGVFKRMISPRAAVVSLDGGRGNIHVMIKRLKKE